MVSHEPSYIPTLNIYLHSYFVTTFKWGIQHPFFTSIYFIVHNSYNIEGDKTKVLPDNTENKFISESLFNRKMNIKNLICGNSFFHSDGLPTPPLVLNGLSRNFEKFFVGIV